MVGVGLTMVIDGFAADYEVYCQFLRSELYRFRDHPASDQLAALVNNPDFDDLNENTARHIFLFSERGPLLSKLPSPLRWYRGTMQLGDLERLRLIAGNCGWQNKATDNSLGNIKFPSAFEEIGQQKITAILDRVTAPDFDRTLLLISERANGPFTILDGNHRATAMMVAKRKGEFTEAGAKTYIGVSPAMRQCIWFA